MKKLLSGLYLGGVAATLLMAAPTQKLAYALGGEADSLDPALNSTFRASIVIHSMFTGLEKLGANGKLIPGMASSYSVDKTKKVYTFTIAKDAKWSDGKPVTLPRISNTHGSVFLTQRQAPLLLIHSII